MGGKSSSKSTTSNYNINQDNRIVAEGEARVYANNIVGDGNTVTDFGAVTESFEFANNALDFAETTQGQSFHALNENTKLAFEFANNATISADERIVNKMVPIFIIGGVILMLFLIMKGKK